MSKLDFIYCVLISLLHFAVDKTKGQIYFPSNTGVIVVPPGTTAAIVWTYVGDPSKASQSWYFTRRSAGSKEQEIAHISRTSDAMLISSNIVPRIAIEKPATLILKNVDERYNGKYRFSFTGPGGGGGESSVEFFVAETPRITFNCSSVTTVNQSDYFACGCNGTHGNPPANVTWYKNNTQIVTGKEKAIVRFPNVKKNAGGTYRCVAKSGIEEAKNETEVKLIVNYPPENVRFILTRSGQSATITCTAEAQPGPSFKIFLNETTTVKNDTVYIIPEVNSSLVGFYKCVAENMLGNAFSDAIYLSLTGTPTLPIKTGQSTTNDDATGKTRSDDTTSGTEWYIFVVILVSGIIFGILVACIAGALSRR